MILVNGFGLLHNVRRTSVVVVVVLDLPLHFFNIVIIIFKDIFFIIFIITRIFNSLVVSDLHLENKRSWFESGCYLCPEVRSLL